MSCHWINPQVHFRIITEGKGTTPVQLLTESKPPSPYYKVYENNVNTESFTTDPSHAVYRLLNEPLSTLMMSSQYVPTTKEFHQCQVCKSIR